MSARHCDAGRWIHCAASAVPVPPPPLTESRREGVAVHWAAAETLGGSVVDVTTAAPNGMVLDESMLQAAFDYADVIEARKLPPHVEMRVLSPRIAEGSEGRPDCWQYDQATGVLYLDDLKFGRTVVEAYENWQMIADACGVLDLLGVDGRTDEYTRVVFTVHQPRARHRDGTVRTWEVKASDLRGYFNRLNMAAAAVKKYPRHTTGSHCLHCPRRGTCPAAELAATAAFEYVADLRTEVLDGEALGRELILLEAAEIAVKARRSGLLVDAEARVRAGVAVRGFALIPTRGRLGWAVPAAEVIVLGDLMGLDLARPVEPITPTQALAQAKKLGVDPVVITAYSATTAGGEVLARDTHFRRNLEKAFSK